MFNNFKMLNWRCHFQLYFYQRNDIYLIDSLWNHHGEKIWIKSSNNRNAKFAYELNVVQSHKAEATHTRSHKNWDSWVLKVTQTIRNIFFLSTFFPQNKCIYNYFKFSMWSANSVVLVLNCQYCFVCLSVRCVLFHHLSTTFSFVICWWAGECV